MYSKIITLDTNPNCVWEGHKRFLTNKIFQNCIPATKVHSPTDRNSLKEGTFMHRNIKR
jgi:hypothetical protein